MFKTCRTNHWVVEGTAIAIQVTFVFIFLTMFFFLYVQSVEREEFQKQLNIIVDDISNDLSSEWSTIINSKDPNINKEDVSIIVNGIIDVLQQKMSGKTNSRITEQNHKVKLTALKSLTTVTVIIVSLAVLVLFIGFCMPIADQIKESMLVVIFVGITEFAFLQLIAKNYISASPNRVKRELAQAIQNWIKVNKQR